jgi:N-acetylglucosamine-6-phosphate deacetylase
MLGALRNLVRAKEELAEGGAIEGFHIEGPHISPEDGPRGAHPKAWVRPPDLDEFARWQEAARGQVRLITLSPEWPQATRYIESIVAQGVVASIGHTNATTEQIADAVRAGATMSTHLGNGSHDTLRRHPNYIWDQLAEDGLMAGLIADGIHLPAAFLKVALRAKGIERAVLVTDASSPAGCKPGRYPIGRQVVELTEDDRVVLAGSNRLAGSALRMHRGVENTMRLGGTDLEGAIRMASINPARAVNMPGRKQGLVPGERADFTLFRFDPETRQIKVVETIVGGRQVYP